MRVRVVVHEEGIKACGIEATRWSCCQRLPAFSHASDRRVGVSSRLRIGE